MFCVYVIEEKVKFIVELLFITAMLKYKKEKEITILHAPMPMVNIIIYTIYIH
jgi:hypothetical protein